MSRSKGIRSAVTLAWVILSILIWINLTSLGNAAALRAQQHSVREWGEPIEGTVNPVNDLDIRASDLGPYKEVVVTLGSRITHTYRQLHANMLIRDIPPDRQITTWEQIRTGEAAAANTIAYDFSAVKPNPFSKGGSDKLWGRLGAILLILALALVYYVVVWRTTTKT